MAEASQAAQNGYRHENLDFYLWRFAHMQNLIFILSNLKYTDQLFYFASV